MIAKLKGVLSSLAPGWYNKRVCSTHGLWNQYFQEAERDMEQQWGEIIWPLICDFDFDTVLELAPGSGRNTEKIAQIARVIHAVDMNEYALNKVRRRFAGYTGRCELHFHKNRGNALEMIEDSSISTIYCWDAAVHFEKSVVRDYVKEFYRVLKEGGLGFLHHSNLGPAANADIRRNPHYRSNMSRDLFRQFCEEHDLQIVKQVTVPWDGIRDCISIFCKHSS